MTHDKVDLARGTAVGPVLLLVLVVACGGPTGVASPTPAMPATTTSSADVPADVATPGTTTSVDGWTDDHVQPASCTRMQAAFAALERCAGLTAAQTEALGQAKAVATASYTEACMDEQCPEEGDQAVREDEACTRVLEGLARLALPCPLP